MNNSKCKRQLWVVLTQQTQMVCKKVQPLKNPKTHHHKSGTVCIQYYHTEHSHSITNTTGSFQTRQYVLLVLLIATAHTSMLKSSPQPLFFSPTTYTKMFKQEIKYLLSLAEASLLTSISACLTSKAAALAASTSSFVFAKRAALSARSFKTVVRC